MMPIQKISIPTPCHQDWNHMTVTTSGRHCQSCSKTVVDFTRMSNNEIIGYLSTNHHVCGRIGEQQVDSINMQLISRQPQSKGGWAKWVMAASLFISTAYSRAVAQSTIHPTEQAGSAGTSDAASSLGKIYMPDSTRCQVITGIVTDSNNEPLPGATIKVKGSNIGTLTDANGHFQLRVTASIRHITISFLGFETTTVETKKAGKVLKVKLKDNAVMLGGLGVTRPSLLKQLYARLIRSSVRSMS